MKILHILCIVLLVCVKADHLNGFLENIYDEIRELDLNKEQEKELRNIIKKHHTFLKQWYIDVKKNSDEIMKNFANSSLERHSIELMQDNILSSERVRVEQEFIMNVYDILNKEQRKKFSTSINKQNRNINTLENNNKTFGEFKQQNIDF
ncbi:Spy/CpxP family protein refolding chaperone [Helicobacter sp. MIT 14-3879]|uniref:Spy/CpxP family protein refolding chaperone n=1 Tax=Helicobacter sp. MIT 14-3879 TaxID=2040649 RepID=UPI000E1E7B8A|nr:Spy/CpxP family protein refolding chaperone [Helicobacter sp. MIT 14-3879]RDU65416.1 hypothetical protein CQA44_00025 [Helicobacter sp. MIT 14-3879]